MSWLIVAISAYLILALVFLVDKYLISGPVPNPKVYVFYVGILGILVLVLIPFTNFSVPIFSHLFLALLAGAVFVFALFWLYKSLQLFEASRVVPAIGGLVPLFTFGLIYLFSRGEEVLGFREILALIFLILGSILITYKKTRISLKSFEFSLLSAFLLSLSFVLSKYVYLEQSFLNGFIWIRLGGVIFAIFFLFFSKEVKEEIFKKRQRFSLSSKKAAGIFLSNQALGAGANILQQWAIFLAPLGCVALVNALQGTQYLFMLIFALIISVKFPKVLKEEISKKVIFQKILAILLISLGLVVLAF